MTKLFEPCSTGKRYRRCLDETTKAPRHRVKGAFFTLCVLVSWCSAFSGAQSQLPKWEIRNSKPEIRNLNPGITDQDSPELTLGVPIERRLGASEVHTYRITLAFGQYLRVVVEELGIPVVVSVLKPDGERLIEAMSLYSTYEPIQVSVLADAPGIYRLEVRPQTKTATGKYTVRMEELRDAMPQDKNRVAAESAIAEASRLYEEGTATSRRKAIGKLEEAIPLWQAIDEGGGEGRTLNLIGAFHNELGEWQKALDYYQQALPLLRAAGDRRGEAYSLNDTGNVYRSWGEPLKALNYFDQALLLSRAVGDRNWEAVVLEGIAEVQRSLGKQHEALRFYGQVLPLFRAMGDPSGEEETVALIGEIYRDLGEYQKALGYFQEALRLSQSLSTRYLEARTLTRIGSVYAALGETQKALEYYRQAWPLWQAVGNRRGEASALAGIARAERNRGNLDEARRQIEAALAIIESFRAEVNSRDLRASVFASNQNDYAFYIDLLMRQHEQEPSRGHDVAALQASERARARGLLDLLAEARIDIEQGIDPALKQQGRANQSRINEIQGQLIRSHSRPSPDKNRIAALEDELKQVEQEREQLEIEIRRKHPQYAEVQYPAPIGLEAIQRLLDDHTALLEYTLGQDGSFLFIATKGKFQAARLPSASLITQHVKALRETIATTPQRTARLDYLTNARWLHQELIKPASELLAGKRELIIVPDGILHYLPFEVLLSSGDAKALTVLAPSDWPYLLGDFAIRYAPSASVLANLRAPGQDSSGRQKTFMACADPFYGGSEAGVASTLRSALRSAFGENQPWKLERLVQSRQEAQRIAQLYPQGKADLLLGTRASEGNVKAEGRLSQYRFIHFAAHGLLNENQPQFSGLVLSLPEARRLEAKSEKSEARGKRPGGSKPRDGSRRFAVSTNPPATRKQEPQTKPAEDGLLQVYEIFNLKLNADMVVLSACETGLGKQVRGEGLIGLTRAFLYAGTPSVVVSLWRVSDASTADLMVRFYRHLRDEKVSKAEALRQAQLELIRNGQFAHPYHWAPFVLVGKS